MAMWRFLKLAVTTHRSSVICKRYAGGVRGQQCVCYRILAVEDNHQLTDHEMYLVRLLKLTRRRLRHCKKVPKEVQAVSGVCGYPAYSSPPQTVSRRVSSSLPRVIRVVC